VLREVQGWVRPVARVSSQQPQPIGWTQRDRGSAV
jgi:hypothetical protein